MLHKDQRGSAVVWAMIVIMLLMILVAAALSLSMGYYSRSLLNNDARQAYFSARSVALSLAAEICSSEAEDGLMPAEGDADKLLTDIMIYENDGTLARRTPFMDATISRINEKYAIILVEADVNGQSNDVRLRLCLVGKGKWKVDRFLDGSETELVPLPEEEDAP